MLEALRTLLVDLEKLDGSRVHATVDRDAVSGAATGRLALSLASLLTFAVEPSGELSVFLFWYRQTFVTTSNVQAVSFTFLGYTAC